MEFEPKRTPDSGRPAFLCPSCRRWPLDWRFKQFIVAGGLEPYAMMSVKTPGMFYSLRFLLGVFEAGFFPGIILYLTYWFPSLRRAKVFGMFMCASAFAGVIGAQWQVQF
jgi:MFS family permease